MNSLVGVSIPNKIFDQQSVFVLSLELLLTQASNRVKCFFLDALENLVLSLLVLTYCLDHTQRVCPSTLLELLQCAQV